MGNFRDLQKAAKEINSFFDPKQGGMIEFVGVKKDAIIEQMKKAVTALNPKEDILTDETKEVLKSLGITLPGESINSTDDELPIADDLKQYAEETNVTVEDLKKTASELNQVMQLEPPISLTLDENGFIDEIIDVSEETINFKKSDFSKEVIQVFEKLDILKDLKWTPEKESNAKEKPDLTKLTNILGSYKLHKYCLLFPEMPQDQYIGFADDIAKNGLNEDILEYNGEIADGRSRLKACLEKDVKPRFYTWKGTEEELFTYLISTNVRRRHLTSAQRAVLGANILPELEKIGKTKQKEGGKKKKKTDKPFRATEEAAKMVGSTKESITIAKKIKKDNPEMFKKMEAGKAKISEAKKKEKKQEPTLEQEEVAFVMKIRRFRKTCDAYLDFLDKGKHKISYAPLCQETIDKLTILIDVIQDKGK